MIKPEALWNLLKQVEKEDALWLGEICVALGKRDPAGLTRDQARWYRAIQQDSQWTDERCEKERERKRESIRKMRTKKDVAGTSATSGCSGISAEHPLHDNVAATSGCSGISAEHPLQTAVAGSIVCSDKPIQYKPNQANISQANINHSHSHYAHAGEGQPGTAQGAKAANNGNGNGNGQQKFLVDRTQYEAIREALGEGDEACFDQSLNFPILCCVVCKNTESVARWIQLAKMKGETACREVVFSLVREMRAGEIPNNRGAVLNKRLAALPDTPETTAALAAKVTTAATITQDAPKMPRVAPDATEVENYTPETADAQKGGK